MIFSFNVVIQSYEYLWSHTFQLRKAIKINELNVVKNIEQKLLTNPNWTIGRQSSLKKVMARLLGQRQVNHQTI